MSKPVVADNRPKRVALEKGKAYYVCACGRSQDQPWCDGSHVGTDFTPWQLTAEEDEAYLCMCKHTGNPPFCDGSHKQLADDLVGKEGPGPQAERDQAPRATPTGSSP